MKKYHMIFAGLFSALILCSCGSKEDFAEMITKAEQSAIAGRWEDALAYSKNAQKSNPKSPEAIVLTTLAYEKNGKMNEALAEIQKAVELAPENYFIQYTYGRILYKFKKNDLSLAALKKAVVLRPQSTEARILLARVAKEEKDFQTAYEQYLSLLKNDTYKDKALLHNEIGIYYAQIKRNNIQGREECKKAYRINPKNPIYVLNTAILCDRTYQTKNAKALYQYYRGLTKNNSSLIKSRAAVDVRLRKLR